NSHRLVGNLFDVKLRAIENLWSAGVDIVPVITIVNGINNEQVGRVVQFALDNPKKINFLSFQPVSFTGRDEEVTPERRAAQRVNDAARGRRLSVFGMALALARNYDPFQSPTHFKMTDLLKKFDKTFGATKKANEGAYGRVGGDRTVEDQEKRRADRWNFLFIAGMWFQDLFNYDFRRTERCIIPYATQEGEISFCAYNP